LIDLSKGKKRVKEQQEDRPQKKDILSKTRLRITGRSGEEDLEQRRRRAAAMFSETSREEDEILFQVSSEPESRASDLPSDDAPAPSKSG